MWREHFRGLYFFAVYTMDRGRSGGGVHQYYGPFMPFFEVVSLTFFLGGGRVKTILI